MAEMGSLSAFVLGGSGEIGKEIVRELANNTAFGRIMLVGRRMLELQGEEYQRVEQTVVDFDRLGEYSDAFQGFDVGFCALGTTRGKSGADGFVKVDHDYIVESAKMAREAGCRHFSLVSAQGANKSAWLLYTKTKGQTEEDIIALGYPRLSIYRPALLLCAREESRPLEKVAQVVLKPLDFGRRFSITTSTVAKAMVLNALKTSEMNVEIFENIDILKFAQTNNTM